MAPVDGATDVPLAAGIWTDLVPSSVNLRDPDGVLLELTLEPGWGYEVYQPVEALQPLTTYAITADIGYEITQTFTTRSADLDKGAAPLDTPSVNDYGAQRAAMFSLTCGRDALMNVVFDAAPAMTTLWAVYLVRPGGTLDREAPFGLTTDAFFATVGGGLPPAGAYDLWVAARGLDGVPGEPVEVGPLDVPAAGACSVAAPGRSAPAAGALALVALLVAISALRRFRRS